MISLSPGLLIAGKIRLDREIARGGMGSVWAAWNRQLETPVAVKFMSQESVGSPELVTRFQREAKAAAQIRSPHVVQIFEHGMHIGLPYIVMELLEGEDLGSRLRRAERLSLGDTVDVVVQVCKALRRAHEMGIVHRDLKPANIFLARHDEEEVVKVLDFGIAKSLTPSGEGDDSTQTGTLVGTPHYMSPEQAQRSKQIDARSDLWSLSVIAFRALTGRVPFKGDDMINVLVKVCTEPVPAPSSFAPDLGPEVDALFKRALCRDIDGRFQSAREMSDAFAALMGRRSLSSIAHIAGPSSSRASVPVPMPLVPQAPLAAPPPPNEAATVANDAASKGDADRTAVEAVLSAPPGPLTPGATPHGAIAAGGAPPVHEPTGTIPPFKPSKTRAAIAVGGVVLATVLAIALVGSSGSPPSGSGVESTGSAAATAPPSASPLPSPSPSPVPATSTAPTPEAPAPSATAASSTNAAPTSIGNPTPTGSARPSSSAKGTVPRATPSSRPTGAIGGAPKF